MTTNLDSYKKDLTNLITMSDLMNADLVIRVQEEEGKLEKEIEKLKAKVKGLFEKDYQR